MNNVFTLASKITLTTFRAQASHGEPENKEMIYNFGYKGLYPRGNVKALLLCEV